MPTIRINGVPEDDLAVPRRSAASAGPLLQEYMVARLRDDAQTPTLTEVLERIDYRTGGKLDCQAAARSVREDRDAR